MAELTRDDDDDKVTAYRDAITTWVDSAGGRDLDRMAKGQLRDVAAKLTFSTNKGRDELRLPRRTRAKGDVLLVATHPTPDASLLENATTTSSLRLCWDDKELFTVQALATGAAPEFEELQVRTACDGRALIELRLQALPLVDEPADVLHLLLALPWLPDNDLATHVRNRLMEDLLVDLCDIEGSESVLTPRPWSLRPGASRRRHAPLDAIDATRSHCSTAWRRHGPTARRRGGGRSSRGARETHRSRSTQEHDCATEKEDDGGERPMVRRKTSESVPVAGQKRKK